MMSRLACVVSAVGIAAFLLSASGPAFSASTRVVPVAPAAPVPHLGIVSSYRGHGVWRTSLVRIDSRTLQVQPGRQLPLSGFDTWSLSRDGSRLAFADVDISAGCGPCPPTVGIVDTKQLRKLGHMQLAPSGEVRATAWLPNGTFVAVVQIYVPFRTEVVTLDGSGKKVLERQTFPGQLLRIARTRGGVVVLLTPGGYDQTLGPARLLIVEPNGRAHVVVVPGIDAGYQQPSNNRGPVLQREPGLTVDFVGRRAFVIADDGQIAEVVLRTGAVSSHAVTRRVSFLGRLRAWLEPVAEAKLPREGSTRIARWLGSGMIAVSGGEYAAVEGARRALSRFTPAGLEVIDTRNWSARKLGARTDSFWHVGGLLLAAATISRGYELDVPARPTGLIAYGAGGRERFRLYPGQRVRVVYANRWRAFVSNERGIDVIDLRSGRIAERRSSASFVFPLVPSGPATDSP